MKLRNLLVAVLVAASMLVFVSCGPNITSQTAAPAQTTSSQAASSAAAASPSLSAISGMEATLESIYSRVDPSVVNINVLKTQSSSSGNQPGIPGLQTPTPQYSAVQGSGFLWDNQGHIVTNNHVISDAANITVTLYDGTIIPAKVIGADYDSDLAVLKVNLPANENLQPLTMADSTKVKVGEMAIAIGNPFGLTGTMTVGFVSSLGRLLPTNENATGPTYSIPDIIQTDAAINPGNSGGVLLDKTGEVMGVTSSIATSSGTSAGIGFAIPSAILKQVIPALISQGHYSHPYLGVTIASLSPDVATAMNLPSTQRGALVVSVTSGSPADKAGLKGSSDTTVIDGQQIPVGGDVIIAYDGQTVRSSDDLITLLARHGSVGQSATLTVLRDGKKVDLKVILGARPNS